MSASLKFLAVANAVAILLIALWVTRAVGITATTEADWGDSIEIQLVPLYTASSASSEDPVMAAPAPGNSHERLPEFSRYDLSPPAWEVDANGRVRFLDTSGTVH